MHKKPILKLSTFARLSHFILVLITALVFVVSCIFLLSQTVRTAPNRSWKGNINALVIGAAYIILLLISVALCLKRRLSIRLKLARMPHERIAIRKGDVPTKVHLHIEEEFLRSCAITYAAMPKVTRRDGWGAPGTKYENMRFRTVILDTLPRINEAIRLVIPSMPPLLPRMPVARHLRHIRSLVTAIENGEKYLEIYCQAIERVRCAEQELTEEEFEEALHAGASIVQILHTYAKMLHKDNAVHWHY